VSLYALENDARLSRRQRNKKYKTMFLLIIGALARSRDFKMEDGRAEIPLNVTVQGDVLVVIYHARSTLGGRLQAKVHTHTHTHIHTHA